MIDSKIQEEVFRVPEKWVHIRGIAKSLKISPESVRKWMAVSKIAGIIETKKEGNSIFIRANVENEKYKQEKRVSNLRCLYKSEVIDFLDDYFEKPKAIVFFGSYSRGEDLSSSDIDLAVVVSGKKRPNLSKFEKILDRKIELSVFTRKEISNEFFNNLINGIVLKGFLKNE